MTGKQGNLPPSLAWTSPWQIIGCVCVLAAVLLILTVKNFHREKQFMEEALLSQAHVLMRSIEAGSRTGMMGMGWGHRQLQLLLEETASQPGVRSVALVDASGKVMAHSNPERVGHTLDVKLPPAGASSHWFSEDDERAFQVARAYRPWVREGQGRGARRKECEDGPVGASVRGQFILVGMDPEPFEEARWQDLRQTLLLSGMMLLMGAAGFLSLFWAHHYRSARRSLKDMEAFTATIVQQMPVGMFATDSTGRIHRDNDAARAILKTSRPIRGNLADFPCFLPISGRLKDREAVVEEEVFHATGENLSVPLLINAAVIRDDRRRARGQVFLFSDISGLKHLEEELRRSERLASLGRLAAGIAHEVRNPLSSIKGFATILAKRADGDEKSRQIADVMIQEVERLNRVVTELLEYARPTELCRRHVSCRGLIAQALQLVQREADQRQVTIGVRVEPEGMKMDVDPDRFVQVLLNLFLNGLQAMENGGVLSVEVKNEGTEAVLAVSDTGSGISIENLPHVFDPYFTTKPGGVGLGLANVHKLVEAHGGKVEVSSGSGSGTRFVVRIPETSPGQRPMAPERQGRQEATS